MAGKTMSFRCATGGMSAVCIVLVLGLIRVVVAQESPPLKIPTIGVVLPEAHNTPDGMTLDSQGNILLSCPNFNTNIEGNEQPAWIMKITPDDKLQKYFRMPVNRKTKKACPLGLDFAEDGNLYVADSQGIGGDTNYRSALLRIVVENGKPVRCEPVVVGFVLSNAVACHGDCVYVTESHLAPESGPEPNVSAVYRFTLSELKGPKPIRLRRGGRDPHIILKLVTKNEQWQVGANGLGFGPDGTMYVCNFGDAALIAAKLDDQGKVVSQRIVAQGEPIMSADGLKVDQKTGLVYMADFLGNAVHCIDPKTGNVRVIAKNGPTDGSGGLLDKCSEVCLRGNRLYVANIDLNLDGNEFDKPYTVSVIDLRE